MDDFIFSMLPDQVNIDNAIRDKTPIELAQDYITEFMGVLINFPKDSEYTYYGTEHTINIKSTSSIIHVTITHHETQNTTNSSFYRSKLDTPESRDRIGTVIAQYIILSISSRKE